MDVVPRSDGWVGELRSVDPLAKATGSPKGGMDLRARFLGRPDMDTDEFKPPEGLAFGGEFSCPQDGKRWRLEQIETRLGEPPTFLFEPLSPEMLPTCTESGFRPEHDDGEAEQDAE